MTDPPDRRRGSRAECAVARVAPETVAQERPGVRRAGRGRRARRGRQPAASPCWRSRRSASRRAASTSGTTCSTSRPIVATRPSAIGRSPPGSCRSAPPVLAGVALPIIALALAAATGRWQTVAVVATYIVITIAYTIRLKHVPVVDLVTVASGFVLRAAAGAVAVDVPMSRWFVLCITFGSLFIVIGKRYAELQRGRRRGRDAGRRSRSTRWGTCASCCRSAWPGC